ncbi:poly-gamma-glutamate hydrolase family protein [Actinoplanes sp. NPDC051859]|uniref:poly-gamma-glutamate hydrolase family protein n=1 Tax=Actinoplanes sp. NPDC051859 TaxID=3363909 RepID=UPI0037B61691
MNRRHQTVLAALAVPVALSAGYALAGTRPAPAPQAAAPVPQAAAPAAGVAEYPSMTALRKVEKSGVAYDLSWTVTDSPLIVVAPHGGDIEVGTSEIAAGIAGNDIPAEVVADRHTLCQFTGKLKSGNSRLHVTSEHWDVEECLILIRQRTHALSIHGVKGSGKEVYIGGRDTTTGARLRKALEAKEFGAPLSVPGEIAGVSPDNFVNKDADGAGVQLELSRGLRDELFDKGKLTPRGEVFIATVRAVYGS